MENKTFTVIEHEKNGKKFTLLIDPTSTLGEVHDVLFEMKQYIIEWMNKVDAEQKEKKDDSCPT